MDESPMVTMMTEMNGLADERPQDEALHENGQGDGKDQRQEEGDEKRQLVLHGQGEAEVRADHDQLALSEIDDLGGLENDDKSQRHQTVDGADHQAVYDELEIVFHK